MYQKLIISLIIFSIVLPSFAFGQIAPPETMEGVKEAGKEALKVGEKKLPNIIKRIWQEDALPIWTKMWNWFKVNILPKLRKLIMPEYEKRKEYFEESFESKKEDMKEEVKEEAPKVTKYFWEKLKDLIK